MSNEALLGANEALLGALVGMLGVISMITLIWLVIVIIADWKIYTKAGEAGWKCLIPFYSTYVRFSFTWDTTYFWIILGIAVVSAIISALHIPVIGTLLSIASIVINIIALHKLSKSFGHDIGFTLGLIFLNPIFILILAFGGSEYIGPQ